MGHSEDSDVLRPPTPEVDAKVSELASRLQTSGTQDTSTRSGKERDDFLSDDDDDEDKLFEELEKDEFDMSGLREKRMEELKAQIAQVRDMRENEHGRLTEITDEKEVIKTSANESRCIIHFYHRDFRRCDIMNKHLEILAPRHFKTRFIKVFVENVPWLVEKLQVKVLPCVISFIRGVSKDRIVGFEELGNEDGFKTGSLELRLTQSGVIDKPDQPRQKLVTPFGSTGMVGSSGSRIRGRDDSDEEYHSDD